MSKCRVPWMVSSWPPIKNRSQDCSTLAKKICRSARFLPKPYRATQIVGTLAELTGTV
jgi:hypothetical protein